MRKLVFIAATLLVGCQSIHPYRVDVQQGNYVTQEMVAKLKPGMTRSQVRYTLGAPLIVDSFHPDRWDYVYAYNKAGRLMEQRRIFVIFEGDKLVRIEGDVVPGSPPVAATGDKPSAKPPASPPAPPATTAKPEADGGDPAASTGKPAVPVADDKAASADAGQPGAAGQSEKGFFGRMLEKMGF